MEWYFWLTGKKFTLSIGEKDTDPVFSVPDILPHLSYKVQDREIPGKLSKVRN